VGVTAQTAPDGTTITLLISDRFDFSVYRDLKKAYDRPGNVRRNYVVDLRGASYMDSSALGMLLQLREYAGGDKGSVRITNVRPALKEILRIANFDKLMVID
jgi:anti-anti-sigma factor